MSALASPRDEYTPDPLSPFQASSERSLSKPSHDKSDLEFIQKVTNTTATGNIFWDKTERTSDAMAKSSLAPTEKTKKAVSAFQDLRRRRRVKEEFNHFCSETSFTALVRIYKASSWKRQFGWTILLLGMLSWLIVQVYWLLASFFSYPMEVKMDINAAKELEFPSVSICNLNPVKKSALMHSPEMSGLLHFTDQIKKDDVLYDFYYSNYDWVYSRGGGSGHMSSTPHTWSTPGSTTRLGDPTASTKTGPTNLPTTTLSPTSTTKSPASSSPSGPPLTQPKPSSTTSTSPAAPTTRMGPGGPGPGGPGRRKREASDTDPSFDTHEHQHQVKRDIHDVIDDAAKELHWKALEKEIFGEELSAGRFRRQAMHGGGSSGGHSERLDVLRNNSFNKWDALADSSSNISYYTTRGAEYKAAMSYATVAAKLDPEMVKNSGHALNDLLITCRYDGFQCSPSNFTHFHSHKYGNCFTFNHVSVEENLYTMFAGPEFGLTLEMYIQQDEYVPALAAEAGVRVMIHPKGKTPFPEDEGISVSPMHSTSISLRKVEIIRLGEPHGTCNDQGTYPDLYSINYNTSYSKLSCLKSCYQSIVNRYCNCSVPQYYVTSRETVCNMTDDDVDNCVGSLPKVVPSEYDACDKACPQPCYDVDYDMVVSSAMWPSEAYEDYLEDKLKQTNYLLMDGKDEENFVKLNVFFKDLLYEKVEQQRAYESQNLISDIGGQLGLWLGLSAITIGEICGLMLSLFRSLTSEGNNKNGNSSSAVKPFSKDLEPNPDRMMLSDVKSRGFV